MIDRDKFFAYARQHVFGGSMSAEQVRGMTATLDEWETRKLTDLRKLAYILATKKWETAHTMQPVRETRAKTDLEARQNLAGVWYAVPDPITNESYYGRGDVQLTHKRNYAKMTALLGQRFSVDLVTNPDKALDPVIAVAIMFEGMLRADSGFGDFTGVALEDYFNDEKCDWLNARRIVNGTDHAADIMSIALGFYAALGGDVAKRLLKYGASGPDVKELQTMLNGHGFYSAEIDGDFGPVTKTAVEEFQTTAGLVSDGIVGPKTWAELNA